MKTGKTIFGSFLAILILIVAQFFSQLIIMALNKVHLSDWTSSIVGMLLYMLIAYFLIKLLVTKYLKLDLKRVGIIHFQLSTLWIIVGILLPIIVLIAYFVMGGKFQLNSSRNFPNVIMNIFYGSIAAGFVEELVFRGVILHLFSMRWNKIVGILLPSLIFASMHLLNGNLNLLSASLLLIAGTLAGVMFSLIEMSENNFWNDAFVHAMWNLITSALICVNVHPQIQSLYTFIPNSKIFIITGGEFGMEASIISVISYILIVFIAKLSMDNK